MYRIFFIAAAFLLFLSAPSKAQVGVGIWPAKLEVDSPFLKTTYAEIYLFNPAVKNVSLDAEFYCKNCERDFELFGKKLGKISYELDIQISPSELELSNISLAQQKILIKIPNSLLLKRTLKTEFFGKRISIPIYAPHFNKMVFDGLIIGRAHNQVEISVASRMTINFYGISTALLLLAVVATISIATIAYHQHLRRILRKYGFYFFLLKNL